MAPQAPLGLRDRTSNGRCIQNERYFTQKVTDSKMVTEEEYLVLLRCEQSRVSPSVQRIAREFRQFGIQVRESQLGVKASSLNEADFEAEVPRMQAEGRELDAIGTLRQRHRLSAAEARQRLEALAYRANHRGGASD